MKYAMKPEFDDHYGKQEGSEESEVSLLSPSFSNCASRRPGAPFEISQGVAQPYSRCDKKENGLLSEKIYYNIFNKIMNCPLQSTPPVS